MKAGVGADRIADLVRLQALDGVSERGGQVLDVRFAQIAGQDAVDRARLGVEVRAAFDLLLQAQQLLAGGLDLVGGRAGRQADRRLFQADHVRAGARAFVAQIDDIDPVAGRKRLRQLPRPHGQDRVAHLGLELGFGQPAAVAAIGCGGRAGKLPGHGRKGRALLQLGDQLVGAVLGDIHAADAIGVQEDLADLELGLGGFQLQLTQHRIDLVLADLQARAAVTALDPSRPADLGPDLLLHGIGADAGAGQGLEQLIAGHAVARGDPIDLVLYIIIIGYDLEFLLFFLSTYLLNLKMLVDQGAQRLLLDLLQGLLGRLHARRHHQQAHALAQVIGGDDLVVDDRRHALAQRIDRRGGGRGRALGGSRLGQGPAGQKRQGQRGCGDSRGLAGPRHERARPLPNSQSARLNGNRHFCILHRPMWRALGEQRRSLTYPDVRFGCLRAGRPLQPGCSHPYRSPPDRAHASC